jgi:L-rhamnose-H+ transport protein
MLNLALAFGSPIATAAASVGATSSGAENAIWALATGSGALANVAYALFLLSRHNSWARFWKMGAAKEVIAPALMGVLWMSGIVVYGTGTVVLGKLGAVIGWPLFIASVIVTANTWAHLTGEWKHAPPAATRLNFAGIGALLLAIVGISSGGRF